MPTRRSDHDALAVLGRLLGVGVARACRLGFGIEPKYFSDKRERLGLVELAGDDEHAVVGLVVLLVEGLQVFDRHALDVGAVADGGFAVVVPLVGGRHRCAG